MSHDLGDSERGWLGRARDRLPRLRPTVGATGPSVEFDQSRRAAEREALRQLVVKMSRRRVLWATVELEVEDAAYESATELLVAAEEARLALPGDSRFDPLIETLQDACNQFRAELEQRGDGFPFGPRLYELRAAALQFATGVVDAKLKLPEAERLVEKIDMSTALSAIGNEQRAIYVKRPDDFPPRPNSSDADDDGHSPGV